MTKITQGMISDQKTSMGMVQQPDHLCVQLILGDQKFVTLCSFLFSSFFSQWTFSDLIAQERLVLEILFLTFVKLCCIFDNIRGCLLWVYNGFVCRFLRTMWEYLIWCRAWCCIFHSIVQRSRGENILQTVLKASTQHIAMEVISVDKIMIFCAKSLSHFGTSAFHYCQYLDIVASPEWWMPWIAAAFCWLFFISIVTSGSCSPHTLVTGFQLKELLKGTCKTCCYFYTFFWHRLKFEPYFGARFSCYNSCTWVSFCYWVLQMLICVESLYCCKSVWNFACRNCATVASFMWYLFILSARFVLTNMLDLAGLPWHWRLVVKCHILIHACRKKSNCK